jgi:acyl-CoA synthetase (AMP-forming)/AMP-acid ligase II/acyl carrier protein
MGTHTQDIASLVLDCVKQEPEKTAVVTTDGSKVSYGVVGDRIQQMASVVRLHGRQSRLMVGLWFAEGEWAEYVVAYFGTLLAGASAVVLPTDVDRGALRRICNDVGVSVLISTASVPMPRIGVPRILLPLPPDADLPPADSAALDHVEAADRAAVGDVLFTAGTTGEAKPVAASRGALAEIVRSYHERPGGAEVVAHAVSHTTAIGTRGVLLGAVARGATIVSCVPFNARDFIHSAADQKAETAVLPAAYAKSLLRELERAGPESLPAMRTLRLVSDHLDPSVHSRLAEALPQTRILNVYGLTEAGDAHLVATSDDCHLGPGGYPAAGTEVRIMLESGDVAPPNSEGFICLRGSSQPLTYLTRPRLAAWTWRDGWTVAQDVGLIDDAGRVHFKRRSEELVRTGERTVLLPRVQEALESHPAITKAVVVPLEHPTLGQSVGAVVEALTEVDVERLRDFLCRSLPDDALPSPIVRVHEIPLSRSGKPQRDAIVGLIREHASSPVRPCETRTESVIASVWSRVLNTHRPIGREDNFFDLGGDSLAAIEAVEEMENDLGTSVSVEQLIQAPDLRALAADLDRAKAPEQSS